MEAEVVEFHVQDQRGHRESKAMVDYTEKTCCEKPTAATAVTTDGNSSQLLLAQDRIRSHNFTLFIPFTDASRGLGGHPACRCLLAHGLEWKAGLQFSTRPS